MHISRPSQLLAAAALMTVLGLFSAPAFAENETDIPKNAYHGDTLTPTERAAIAEEENVSPADGRASTPAPQDRGVIPDADDPASADVRNSDVKAAAPAGPHKKTAESEADVILDDSKKNDRVTHKDLDECLKQWDAQSQMSKSEWADSCRTTLEYFPEEQN